MKVVLVLLQTPDWLPRIAHCCIQVCVSHAARPWQFGDNSVALHGGSVCVDF